MRYYRWILLAISIALAVSVTVIVFDLGTCLPAGSIPDAGTVRENGKPILGKPSECETIQARIDAVGRPGWDGLDATLQADIRKASSRCIFIGDGESF